MVLVEQLRQPECGFARAGGPSEVGGIVPIGNGVGTDPAEHLRHVRVTGVAPVVLQQWKDRLVARGGVDHQIVYAAAVTTTGLDEVFDEAVEAGVTGTFQRYVGARSSIDGCQLAGTFDQGTVEGVVLLQRCIARTVCLCESVEEARVVDCGDGDRWIDALVHRRRGPRQEFRDLRGQSTGVGLGIADDPRVDCERESVCEPSPGFGVPAAGELVGQFQKPLDIERSVQFLQVVEGSLRYDNVLAASQRGALLRVQLCAFEIVEQAVDGEIPELSRICDAGGELAGFDAGHARRFRCERLEFVEGVSDRLRGLFVHLDKHAQRTHDLPPPVVDDRGVLDGPGADGPVVGDSRTGFEGRTDLVLQCCSCRVDVVRGRPIVPGEFADPSRAADHSPRFLLGTVLGCTLGVADPVPLVVHGGCFGMDRSGDRVQGGLRNVDGIRCSSGVGRIPFCDHRTCRGHNSSPVARIRAAKSSTVIV